MNHGSNDRISLSVDHFFRGAFSIDLVLLSYHSGKLKLLVQTKQEEPFVGELGLPGKLILPNEDTDEALDKFLAQLIGTNDFYKKQLRAFSEVGRHPLGRVVSFAYYGLIPYEKTLANHSNQLSWYSLDRVPKLSYDHDRILSYALSRFKKGLLRHPNVFELLPEEFTIPDMIAIFEQAFNHKIDASNFGRQVKRSELLLPLNRYNKGFKPTGRPAQIYTLNRNKYKRHPKDRIQFNF